MNPSEAISRGREILDPIFEQKGFAPSGTDTGKGSGGSFATVEYSDGMRKVSLSFRYSLGCIEYTVGKVTMTHEQYLKGIGEKGQYPGFPDNPIDGFSHLASDIVAFGSAFFTSNESDFAEILNDAIRHTRSGFSAI